MRRFTIGPYPDIKLVQARRQASEALERVRAGADPLQDKRVRRDAVRSGGDNFGSLVRDYLERHGRKNLAPRTYAETKRILELDDLKDWRARSVAKITRRDVMEVVQRIEMRAEIQANRTLARSKALFSWAVQKDRIAVSPAAGIKPPTKEAPRDRVLSDDEMRWLWSGCEEIDWPFGPLVKLLMLTAQRRDEVAGMAWSEIDLDKRTWTIPGRRVKNDRAHVVHLSEPAIAVLRGLPRISDADGTGGLVFTTTGHIVG